MPGTRHRGVVRSLTTKLSVLASFTGDACGFRGAIVFAQAPPRALVSVALALATALTSHGQAKECVMIAKIGHT